MEEERLLPGREKVGKELLNEIGKGMERSRRLNGGDGGSREESSTSKRGKSQRSPRHKQGRNW